MKHLLKSKGIEAVLITSAHNMRYLSGFTGGEGALVVTSDKKYIIVDSRYTIQAKLQTKNYIVIEYSGNIFLEINKLNIKILGFEDNDISYSQYISMNENIKNCIFIGVSDEISKIRIIKSKKELECIKKAEHIGDLAFEHILDYIKPGVSEIELSLELEYFMRNNGAEALAFDTVVAFGQRAALPHAYPTENKVKNGDFVLMDYGCKYNGYCSDMTRTVCFGKASERQRKIYDLVLKAQIEAIKVVREGISCKSVDKVSRNVFKQYSLDKYFSHSLGHGVGLLIHESPNLSPKSVGVLSENMVVTIEPGLYFENEFGVRIEDLVVVTKDGCENYTQSNKELIQL